MQSVSKWQCDKVDCSAKNANFLAARQNCQRAIYFTFRNFFLSFSSASFLMISLRQINLRSQDPLDRFSQSFHRIKALWVEMIDLDLFFDISRYVAMATNFWQNLQNDLHSAPWHFKMECTIVLQMSTIIAPPIALHRVKNGENRFSSF